MMEDKLRIRAAVAADLGGVFELERGAAVAPHWTEGEYAAIVGVEDDAGLVQRCLLVAERDERLVGFAVGKVIGAGVGLGELESVAVDVVARRTGVGRTLCVAVIGWCRERGAKAMELEVRAGSEGAIALYRSLRFAEVGRRGKYYRAPAEDAVLMRLELVGDE
jgi:[ribosomal protein S18]-alanine N-acetyltransferase